MPCILCKACFFLKENYMKKVIVIGGGFGGMAAAIRLRKKGYLVELVDRCNKLGGRAQVFERNGFKYDAGPTLITAPFLFKELFEIHNKNISDYVKLKPIDPWYRFIFHDNTILDYESSLERTISNISKINTKDAANYNKMLNASKDIYDLAFTKLADVPFNSFFYMLKQIPALVKFRADRSVFSFVSSNFENDKIRRAFSIQPLLVGGNPFTTTCIYSLIHFLERKHGVHFAMGGTGALVKALAELMKDVGIKISLNTTIEKIEVKNRRINKIFTETGKEKSADYYISNMDPLHLYNNLITSEKSILLKYKKKFSRHSMGLFVLFFGTKKKYSNIKHHTIIFGKEYRELLDKIFLRKQLSNDISIYLHRPTATDKSFAPKGCDSFYALIPVPDLSAKINWKEEGKHFKENVLNILDEKILPNLKKNIIDPFYMTPKDFEKDYLAFKGTGFSIAPFFTQSAWFRFHNHSEEINNLYLVGAGTHPGAGIPGVLSSAKVIDKLL